MSPRPAPARAWVPDLVLTLVVAVVVLGPALLTSGYVLRGDMVFVPQQPWKPAWLGLDGSVPRAVPMDAVISWATTVVPGQVVQKAALLGSLLVAGLGVGHLAHKVVGASALGRTAAIVGFLWNPWVAERLAIGQWATVAGYALLPWVVLAALRLRDGSGGWSRVAVVLVLAGACSPPSGLVAAAVALVIVAVARGWRATLVVALLGAVANLPWLLPSVLLPGGTALGEGPGFEAFALRSESPLGELVGALSLGGIWKESVVPDERSSVVVVGAAAALGVAALAALFVAGVERRLRRALVVLALGSLVVAVGPGIDPVAVRLDAAAHEVPALAVLRDSHRFLAPLAVPVALGLALLADRLRAWATPGRGALVAAAVLVVTLPALLLPSLAWGLGGRLAPVDYPAEWTRVADLVRAQPGAATVVLPWAGSYRGFGWNDHRAVLDPAPRFLPGEVLVDDRVLVDDLVIPSEDARLQQVGEALGSADPVTVLHDLGVRWVLVERTATGALPGPAAPVGPSVTVRHDGPGLLLLDLGPVDAAPPRLSDVRRGAVVAVDVAVLTFLVTAAGWMVATGGYAAREHRLGRVS